MVASKLVVVTSPVPTAPPYVTPPIPLVPIELLKLVENNPHSVTP